MLRVIFKQKERFTMDQYDNVTAISYVESTKIVTITYGPNNVTTSYDLNNWIMTLFSI